MTLTSFTAGDFTLSGWVSEFTNSGATPSTAGQFITPTGGPASDFLFTPNTFIGPSTTPPTATADSAQVISIADSSNGADNVSLTISFDHLSGGSGSQVLENASDTVVLVAGGSLTLGGATGESASALIVDLKGLQVVDASHGDPFGITFTLTDVTLSASTTFSESFVTACYAPGTRIATPAGEVAVEDLQIGDLVATTSGVAKPVKWIGRRSYSAAAVAGAVNLHPVLIRKDALAAGMPCRDLAVSPMHALLIDEVFVPAAALVNGVSIVRRQTAGPVEYIHIELDQHDVIFAEGTPAETFVDDDSRAMFDNASEYYDLYGFTTAARGFSAPRLEEGYQLEAIRRRLAGKAPQVAVPGVLAGHVERLEDGMLEGWVMDRATLTAPVELEVLVDGEIVATVLANRYRVDLDRAGLAGGCCGFTVAMPASAVNIAQVEVRRASDGGQVAMPQRALVTA